MSESLELNTPIVLNIVDKNMETILAKYVFNSTNEKIKKILHTASSKWSIDDKKELAKLNPNVAITSAEVYGGGDENGIDDHIIEDIMLDDGLLIDDTSITFDEEDIRNITDSSSTKSTELFNTDTPVKTQQPQSTGHARNIPQISQAKIIHDSIRMATTTLYRSDNITTFKQKVYLETGIPPYRQHLWVIFNNRPFQLSYRIKHDTYQTIDIVDTLYVETILEGIPVDTMWYASKEFISVESNEHITLQQIISKYQTVEIYCIDLSSFIPSSNIETIAQLITNDSYAYDLIYWGFIVKYYPMLSQGVFKEYITNPGVMKIQYPLVHPSRKLMGSKFEMEHLLLTTTSVPKPKPNMIKMNIVNSTIVVRSGYIHSDDDIILRNLFDMLPLSEVIHTCICNTQFDGHKTILIKKHTSIADVEYVHLPSNTIQYTVMIPKYGIAKIQINKTGNYKIIGDWVDGSELMFTGVFKVITESIMPIIENINAFGSTVSTRHIETINIGNGYFTNINMSIYIKQQATTAQFKTLRKHIDQFVTAGIMERVELDNSTLHYYQVKGVFMHDMNKYRVNAPLNNEYAPMYDSMAKHRWTIFITKKKSVKIIRRFSDIKIEVEGLREEEFKTWYTFLLLMLKPIIEMPSVAKTQSLSLVDESSSSAMKIRHMKEMDPMLYDLKKIYGKKVVYSQVCQKQHQPLIHDSASAGRTKYWNFTTKEPMWYSCPDERYPYLYFKTGVHPRDYCMPCCKKKEINLGNSDDKQTKLYNQCMETHAYKKSGKNLSRSRYVKTYSKFLYPNRISRLPEDTLEPLMYDNFAPAGIDEECTSKVKDKGYYIFGVPQHTDSVSNIGFIYCICHALELTVDQFVMDSIAKIKASKTWFVLLAGTITHYFATQDELINEMKSTLINHSMSTFDKWNDLFINITHLYWGVNVVTFVDRGVDSTSGTEIAHNADIHLYIPGNVRYVRDLISSNKSIIVINRGSTFYPVYMMYTNIYFKSGKIDTRIFDGTTHAIGSVRNIVRHYLQKWSSVTHTAIDLHIIMYFATHNDDVTIKRLFINDLNMCYGVHLIVGGAKNSVYIPVAYSVYYSGYELTFDIMGPEHTTKWDVLKPVITRINEAITNYSNDKHPERKDVDPVYPHLEHNIWMTVANSKSLIGFVSQSMLFYVKGPISKEDVKSQRVYVIDPHHANIAIRSRKPPSNDTRVKTVNRAIYNNYLYQLLFLTFIDIIHTHRNTPIRASIKKILHGSVKGVKLNIQLVESLKQVLVEYPNDLHNIIRIVTNNNPLDVLDNSFLEFDKYIIRKFTKLSQVECKAAVKKLLDPFLVIGTPTQNSGDMPNMLASCITNTDPNAMHCNKKKLIISKEKLDEYLDILVMDILNPLKAKYLTMYTFIPRSVDYFNFVNRPDERIFITL